jgi:hypothetical protein
MSEAALNPKTVQVIAICCIITIGAAYLLFLYASWNQFQQDRATRDSKIDELLERIPKPKPVAIPDDTE